MPVTISPPLLIELDRCSWDAPYEEDIVGGPYEINYESSDTSTDTLKIEFSHTGPLRFCLPDRETPIDAPVHIRESGTFRFTVRVVREILNDQSNNITFRGLIKTTEESQPPPPPPPPPVVRGCTNPNALNYNSEATEDDGNCKFAPETRSVIPGCTNPNALNYNSEATEDDGTCEYETVVKPEPWYELGIVPSTVTFRPNNDREEVRVSFQKIDADSGLRTKMHPRDGFSVKAADVRSGHLVKFDEQASMQEDNPIGLKLVFQIVPGGWEMAGGAQSQPMWQEPAKFIVKLTNNEIYKDQGGQPLEVTLRLWAEKPDDGTGGTSDTGGTRESDDLGDTGGADATGGAGGATGDSGGTTTGETGDTGDGSFTSGYGTGTGTGI
jgi:hypothetical protein